jgi:SAM-dependent methyltransferase
MSGKLARSRAKVEFDNVIGETYLEGMRISLQKGVGKSLVVNQIANQLKQKAAKTSAPLLIADYGSCEGDMLLEIKKQCPDLNLELYGFDYNKFLIDKGSQKHPDISFVQANILTSDLNEYQEKFDLVFTINTLHEIASFSNTDNPIKSGEENVHTSIINILSTVKPDGLIVIYDGVEHDLDPEKEITVELANAESEQNLLKFKDEYTFFKPAITSLGSLKYTMNIRTFTVFITKYRFLESLVWEFEREERYQYYTKQRWIDTLSGLGLSLMTILLLRPRLSDWQNTLTILTPEVDFPFEHVFLMANK